MKFDMMSVIKIEEKILKLFLFPLIRNKVVVFKAIFRGDCRKLNKELEQILEIERILI